MPTSIPYDPSLALGNIVHPQKLTILEQIAELQQPVDAAQDELDAAILALRSLNLTELEVSDLGIDASSTLKDPRSTAQTAVTKAAKDLVQARIAALDPITKVKSQIRTITHSLESPIDYMKTGIKAFPISGNSISLDAQYFSFDSNEQNNKTVMQQIRGFVSGAFQGFTTNQQTQATNQVQKQISTQRENHALEGTLIITARCSHRNADILAPLVIDVDKAIRVWNAASLKPKIDYRDTKAMVALTLDPEDENAQGLTILSGVTYGSSFVGMVHVLKSDDTLSNQRMLAAATQLQGQLKTGLAIKGFTGGFGIDDSFASDVKGLLSTQQISSHISVVCMGAIPSITGNEVELAVKQFTEFSPDKLAEQLAKLQTRVNDAESLQTAAEDARAGEKMTSIKKAEIDAVIAAVGKLDDGKNKMLDVNSLMNALDKYVECITGEQGCGVPTTYLLRKITASQLAQMWASKYLPNVFIGYSGDDSEKGEENEKKAD